MGKNTAKKQVTKDLSSLKDALKGKEGTGTSVKSKLLGKIKGYVEKSTLPTDANDRLNEIAKDLEDGVITAAQASEMSAEVTERYAQSKNADTDEVPFAPDVIEGEATEIVSDEELARRLEEDLEEGEEEPPNKLEVEVDTPEGLTPTTNDAVIVQADNKVVATFERLSEEIPDMNVGQAFNALRLSLVTMLTAMKIQVKRSHFIKNTHDIQRTTLAGWSTNTPLPDLVLGTMFATVEYTGRDDKLARLEQEVARLETVNSRLVEQDLVKQKIIDESVSTTKVVERKEAEKRAFSTHTLIKEEEQWVLRHKKLPFFLGVMPGADIDNPRPETFIRVSRLDKALKFSNRGDMERLLVKMQDPARRSKFKKLKNPQLYERAQIVVRTMDV